MCVKSVDKATNKQDPTSYNDAPSNKLALRMSRGGSLGSASSEMLRLHRSRPPRSATKVEFGFSDFKAVRVPKGWDRLFVSLVSAGSGKTLAKSSKAAVKNGNCQWMETLQESLTVAVNESSKEFEDCVVKIVVAMGSGRSGMLGEATINMTNYMETGDSVPVSLPLKKCNFGTVLQVKIQCLALPTKLSCRDNEIAEKSSSTENSNLDLNSTDGEINSEGSNGSLRRKALGSTSRPQEFPSQETSCSFRSPEVKPGINERSPLVDDDDDGSARDSTNSNLPSFNSRSESADSGTHLSVNRRDIMMQQMTIPGSSKSLLQAAEDTILELRAESKMWERNAQKSMLDLEMLRKEFSDMSRNCADLEVNLSAANTERDSLKRQVDQLRASLEKSDAENLESQNEEAARIVKELEEEIRFQKESNVDLAMQLRRSQESNIELVAVLQELEEMVDNQKLEIENLTKMRSKFGKMENDLLLNEKENKSLLIQLQEIRESEEDLRSRMNELEGALEKEQTATKHNPGHGSGTVQNEEEIDERLSADKDEGMENLIREMENLREKVRELEKDCDELTEENLELLVKLKEAANASPQGGAPVEFSFNDYGERALSESADSNDGTNSHEEEAARGHKTPDIVVKKDACANEAFEDGHEKWTKLEEMLQLKDQEIDYLTECKSELEVAVSDLEREKAKTRENLDIMRREGEITARCLQEMQNNMAALSKSVHFHVSANKSLERRSFELETGKAEMERHVAELQEEKEQMRLHLSGAESEMRRISDEKASGEIELQELKAQYSCLEDEISGLVDELSKVNEDRNLELIELQNDVEVLRNSVDFHVSANGSLERRSSELEGEKTKFQGRAAELQEETERLRLRLSGLESETRRLSLEKDSGHMELLKSKSRCSDLENEVSRLNDELNKRDEDRRQERLEMQKDMRELSESIEIHVSANKSLEKRSSELEDEKAELERRVAGLQGDKEDLHLQLSGLERETRRLSDEKASSETKLQELKTQCSSLEIELSRLNFELNKIYEERKQEQLGSRIQLSKARGECDSLRNSKLELESTAEKLIQERRSLEILNEELRRQNQDWRSRCLNLEAALEELRGSYDGHTAKIEELEGNISALLENFTSKERSLMAELDVLILENEKQREDLILLNKAYGERTTEIDSLKAEICRLTDELVGLRGERDEMELEKGELELAVREMRDELKSKEAELNDLRIEVEDQKMMMMAEGKLSKQLEIQKSREEKLRTALNELELKLTVSEYERRQLAEESAGRKIHTLKVENLQDQITDLRKELSTAKAEKEKTEALLISASSECKQLRAEKHAQDDRMVALRDSLSELENLKQGRMELEQKLQQAESDIAMKEEICTEAVDMRNELNRVRRENRQYHRAAQQLEEEKEQAMKRARALEDELMAIKEERRNQRESRSSRMPKAGRRTIPTSDHTISIPDESFHSGRADLRSRTSFPDAEFTSAAESDTRLSSDSRGNSSDVHKRSARGGDLVPKERYERTKSSLESELRDIRERYLIMSLKYAEVEAQREELVMKLKANKNSKRWFA